MTDYAGILRAIARDIEAIKTDFPQLGDFVAARHAEPDGLRITYEYHTHPAERPGGWASGVPNPDEDGIWFSIDFHDPDSRAQIHTQPVLPPLRLGTKAVSFLILEGRRVKPVAGSLRTILARHGVSPA